ncbi:hypothetical protein [Sphingomonas sp. M1-B02]|uniref:hypothetical protein n=1 Tax=Sphingomonas sp. M1-B02 TaxID=3114300 RepID=UPI00223E8F04|nr:hypothetical protein [Sphingomonas sp. S6-11]UZK67330.1 hypothetical protein OKW87_05705 [Sphingomonas sp. S6-11]
MMGRRASERLRQERETFDQLKAHDSLWFKLRLTTGLVAIVALLVVLFVAARVVPTPSQYSETTITLASVAILADIAGLAGTVFLLVLRDGSGHLRPIVGLSGK